MMSQESPLPSLLERKYEHRSFIEAIHKEQDASKPLLLGELMMKLIKMDGKSEAILFSVLKRPSVFCVNFVTLTIRKILYIELYFH